MLRVRDVLLDLVYPPRCGGCDRRGTLFCSDCRATIEAPDSNALHLNQLNAFLCAGVFKGPLRRAIHNFKYECDTPLAAPLAALMAAAISTLDTLQSPDGVAPILIPVPLHRTRLRTRGYNQSELLARKLSEITGWSYDCRLIRVRETRTQVGLGGPERGQNVARAFAWNSSDQLPTYVILVDDVCTTGATLSECAATLRASGVKRVCALTVAKALGNHPDAGR